jgi:hypothetical protein
VVCRSFEDAMNMYEHVISTEQNRKCQRDEPTLTISTLTKLYWTVSSEKDGNSRKIHVNRNLFEWPSKVLSHRTDFFNGTWTAKSQVSWNGGVGGFVVKGSSSRKTFNEGVLDGCSKRVMVLHLETTWNYKRERE